MKEFFQNLGSALKNFFTIWSGKKVIWTIIIIVIFGALAGTGMLYGKDIYAQYFAKDDRNYRLPETQFLDESWIYGKIENKGLFSFKLEEINYYDASAKKLTENPKPRKIKFDLQTEVVISHTWKRPTLTMETKGRLRDSKKGQLVTVFTQKDVDLISDSMVAKKIVIYLEGDGRVPELPF